MDMWVLYRDHRLIYVMVDLLIVTVACVLVWRVLSQGGYQAM